MYYRKTRHFTLHTTYWHSNEWTKMVTVWHDIQTAFYCQYFDLRTFYLLLYENNSMIITERWMNSVLPPTVWEILGQWSIGHPDFWEMVMLVFWQTLYPICLQLHSLFTTYDVSKCYIWYQWINRITLQGCRLQWSSSFWMTQLKWSWQYLHSCIVETFWKNFFDIQVL